MSLQSGFNNNSVEDIGQIYCCASALISPTPGFAGKGRPRRVMSVPLTPSPNNSIRLSFTIAFASAVALAKSAAVNTVDASERPRTAFYKAIACASTVFVERTLASAKLRSTSAYLITGA